MKANRFAIIAGFSLVGTLPITATADWSLNPGAGYLNFDNDLKIEDSGFPAVGLEYLFDSGWAVEGAYLSSQADVDGSASEVDYNQYRADVLRYFNRGNKAQPYLAAGLGEGEIETQNISDSETLSNAGFGVRYAFNEALSLRGDARAFYGDDSYNLHKAVTLTLAYRWGPDSGAGSSDDTIDLAQQEVQEVIEEPVEAVVAIVLDDDNDGIRNEDDKCIGTPGDVKVNAQGCPVLKTETVELSLDVKFPVNQDQFQETYFGELKDLATFMDRYKETTAVIEGHSDSLGDASYNKNLSQRRADSIRRVLIEQFNVSAERLEAIGFGEERPIADNKSRQGREMNRRAVANISTQIKTVEKK